jgi:tetratricopeptide (TPR) repeat protein
LVSVGNAYNNIGNVYNDMGNMDDALKSYKKSLEVRQKTNDKKGLASSYNNIGTVYSEQKKLKEALDNHIMSLQLRKEIGDKNGMAASYNNIGVIYVRQNDLQNGLKNYIESLKLKEEIGSQGGVIISCINIGGINISLKKFNEADQYFNRAVTLSTKIHNLNLLRYSYMGMIELDSSRGDYKNGLKHYKLFIACSDSLNNQENTKKIVQQQMQYDFDKKDALAKAEQEKKDLKTAEEKRQQRIIMLFVVGCLLLVVVVGIFIFRSLRINKKKNRIITLQKEMVERQKHIVEEKQKEVLDSIQYAHRIQRALITSEKYVSKNLNRLNSRK